MPRLVLGLILIALLVSMGSAGLLAAEPRGPLVAPPVQGAIPVQQAPDVRMEVLVEGRVLPTVEYEGKTFVVVPRLGVEYEIRLSNLGGRRVMFNVAVDGLSVLNGEAARENGNGYVLSGHRDYGVKGWRRGDDKVAAFSFIKAEASYAALTGRPEGIGTIRLIAVEEQAPKYVVPRFPTVPRKPSPRFQPGNGGGFLQGKASAGNSSLGGNSVRSFGGSRGSQGNGNSQSFKSGNVAGTGYGRELSDHVGRTYFNRSTNVKRITLHYVTTDDLPAGAAKDALKAHLKTDAQPSSDNFTPPPPGYRP